MATARLFIFLQLLLNPFLLFSQQPKTTIDFTKVDSLSRTVKYKRDIYRLTKELTSPYTEQVFKVRAIFIWITDNIRYDYKFVNRGKEIKLPECKPGINCER